MNTAPLIRGVLDERQLLRLDIRDPGEEVIGFLTPVTCSASSDEAQVRALTDWRNQNRARFLTQFDATPERTRRWLQDVVLADDTRLLLWVHSDKTRVGHLGFKVKSNEVAELDNLVRGESGGYPQLMAFAERTLIRWLFNALQFQTIEAAVLHGNFMVLMLHQSIGFRRVESLPLLRRDCAGETYLEPLPSGTKGTLGLFLDILRLTPDQFRASEAIDGS